MQIAADYPRLEWVWGNKLRKDCFITHQPGWNVRALTHRAQELMDFRALMSQSPWKPSRSAKGCGLLHLPPAFHAHKTSSVAPRTSVVTYTVPVPGLPRGVLMSLRLQERCCDRLRRGQRSLFMETICLLNAHIVRRNDACVIA